MVVRGARVLASDERMSYKHHESIRAVIARKEVLSESDAFEFPEHHVARLSLAGGQGEPQQLLVRLGPRLTLTSLS